MSIRDQTKWAKVRIVDLQAPQKWALNGGPFGSKLVSSMYVGHGVPVIRGSNLPFDSRFLMSNFVFVSEDKAQELRPNWARPGDVVFTQRGTLGQVGFIPRNSAYDRFVISQSQMKLTVDPDKAIAEFIYYAFRAPQTMQRITDLASSSGVPHINLETLRNFAISLPPLDIQRRIAGILSAYDDLIEVNTRRIAVIEEMARRLFDEWIVRRTGRLPIPGDRLSEWTLPRGWKFVCLIDVATIIMGQSPPSDRYNTDGRGLPFHQGVTDFDGFFHQNRLFVDRADRPRIAAAGDILFSVRAPVARIAVALDRMVLGRGLAAIRPAPASNRYIFCHLRATFPRPDMIGNGAIYKAVTKADVHSIPIVWPDNDVVEKFERHAEAIWSDIGVLYLSNVKLRAARDILLPKLISGEIDLSGAERGLDAAADQAAAE